MFILDPDPDFLPIPDPGSRGQKVTRSRFFVYLDQSVPLSGGKVERTVVVVQHQLYVVLESHMVGNLTDEYIMSSFIQNHLKNVAQV